VVAPFGLSFPDFLGQGEAFYEALYEDVLADDFPGLDLTAGDIAGLGAGMLVPGEVSGLSDGVVFAASARAIEPLLSRGATLRAERGAGLSHIDLLFANPELGQSMKDRADTDGAWLRPLGERFAAEDTVGWIVEQLATEQGDDDDSGDDDSGDDDSGDDDSSASGDDDSAPDAPPLSGCGCSAPSPPTPTWLAILLLPLAWRRR
jgi:MYXO-CTERM domain-containing protein